jgi:hypothetical protein
MWLLHQPMDDLSGPPARRRWLTWRKKSELSALDLAIEKSGFKTQPWEQCARVLYELGYQRDARFLFRMEQRFLRLKGKPTKPSRFFSFVLGTFVGHGYNVFYTVLWAMGLFVLGAIIADAGYRDGYIVPAPAEMSEPNEYIVGQNIHVPDHDANFPSFHPLLYALDIALPAGDLRQMRYWIAIDKQSDRKCALSPFVGTVNDASAKLIGPLGAEGLYDRGAKYIGRPFAWIWNAVTAPARPLFGWLAKEAKLHPDGGDESTTVNVCENPSSALSLHSAVAVAFLVAILLSALSAATGLRHAATLRFREPDQDKRRQARNLYRHVLNRGRRWWLIWIPPTLVMFVIFSFFFVVTIFLLNARLIGDAIDWLNAAFCKTWLSLSFVHMWCSAETLMGWLLITAVAIGLASAVFRGRD